VIEAGSDPSRRSAVLRLMAWLANVYLVAFAGDAFLSVVDDGLGLLGIEQLRGVRNVVGTAVLAATGLLPFLLLFVPHLPKPAFLPPVAFTLFFLFGGPFAPGAMLWPSVLQLLAAAASFLMVRSRTGRFLLSPARLPRVRHLVTRTLLATAVTLVVLPLAALLGAALALAVLIERETAGYVDFTPSGIDVRESVLTKDDRTVLLMAMAHYGEEDFYRTLFEGMPPGSLILAEGLTDRGKRLRAFPSATRIAKVLGLTQQPGPATLVPRTDDASSGPPPASRPPANPARTRPAVVVADVDAADLSDETLALIHDLADLYAGDAMVDAFRRVLARTRRDPGVFKRELVDGRNAHVLATFDDAAEGYRTIAIPWGALHMPGLEAGLVERGYRLEAQRSRAVVRFWGVVRSLAGGG
jgi:hypothetical protein